MSLQVWLPLNGSLENQGLSDLKFNSVSTVNFGVGKISSQSYNNNDEHAGGIISDKTLHIGNNLSMFCWVNLTQFNTDASLTGIGGMHTISRSDYEVRTGMGITVHSSGKVSFNTGTGTGTGNMPEKYSYNTYQSDVALSLNTWHHIGFTCKQTDNISHVTIYIDGIKHGEFNNILNQNNPDDYVHIASWSRDGNIATPTIFPNYQPKGKINDFRIYDHCLSPREVKLLAQGLVAHYKLDDPRINNLVKDVAISIYNNQSVSATLNATGEIYLGSPIYRLTMTPTADALSSFKNNLWNQGIFQPGNTFAANTKYCYWIYYKPVSHSDIRVGGTASNIGGWTELSPEAVGNGWYRVGQYRDGKVAEAKTDNIYTSFYSPSAAAGVPITIDFCAPHLLAGPTHWVECPYTISSSGGVECDCSGYGNHATISGTIGCALRDSPRYQNSYIFNGNAANRITNTTTQFYYQDNFSWSCWVKHKYPNAVSFAFTVGRANYNSDWGYGLEEVSASSMRIRFGSSSYIVALDENNWHHLAFTKSGKNISIYVDGVPTNYTFNGTPPAYTNSQGLGIGCFWYSSGALYPFYGRLSDFRIYATALPAAAVKDLYQSSISFLDNGTLQCSEIVEKPTNIKYNQNGIVQTTEVEETNTNLKLYNNKIQTYQIYEL